VFVFCVDLRTNSDYFPIQHQRVGFYCAARAGCLHTIRVIFVSSRPVPVQHKARQSLYSTRSDMPVKHKAKQWLYSTRSETPVQHKARQCLYITRADSARTAQGKTVPVQHKVTLPVQHKARQCLYSTRPDSECTAHGQTWLYITRADIARTAQGQTVPVQHNAR